MSQKYTVNQYLISNILSWVQSGEIAIPEIQRPFVWNTKKVRDLMDSLYQGYPIGYIITWKNHDVLLRSGGTSEGKKILIDGQQRVTALRSAILGEKIVDDEYKEKNIIIAFHPIKEIFETVTPAIRKDVSWIADISQIMKTDGTLINTVNEYIENNPNSERNLVEKNITRLIEIKNKQVGFIDLEAGLDIDIVTEIFIRINSKGVTLSQADFAMSKIASYDTEGEFGPHLRKAIDYFAHILRDQKFYKLMEDNDEDFSESIYSEKFAWIKNEYGDIYLPDYGDILKVCFTKEFERGRRTDRVGLLSGRNFETREYEKDIMDDSFKRLQNSLLMFISETHFKRFLMIIKSAGFVDSGLIKSQNAINFAYIVYLKLREQGMEDALIEKYVRRWFVMSLLTSRYSSSPESQFDTDIKSISSKNKGIGKTLSLIEQSELSEAYWTSSLLEKLQRSSLNNPYINVFFAAQVKNNDKGFLSSDVTVSNMITHRGDIHHFFPKEYLKKRYDRSMYNQVANYVYAQSEVNIKIGKKEPKEYLGEVLNQCNGGDVKYGGIVDSEELVNNLKVHCIPDGVERMTIDDYEVFLEKRRILMAEKIKHYYDSL